MAECLLPKQNVEGSNPFTRSREFPGSLAWRSAGSLFAGIPPRREPSALFLERRRSMSSVIKKRRKGMNKHKLRKRRKKERFQRQRR